MLTSDYLADALETALTGFSAVESRGRVVEAVGTLIRANGVPARIGDVLSLIHI